MTSQDMERFKRLKAKAEYLLAACDYKNAYECQRKLVSLSNKIFTPGHANTLLARSYRNLAMWHLGQYDKAVMNQDHLNETCETVFGWDDECTAKVAEHYLVMQLFRRHLGSAEGLATKLLQYNDSKFGEDSTQSLIVKESFAEILHQKCKFDEAASMRKHILDLVISRDEVPITKARALAAYGSSLRRQGKLADSEQSLIQAVQLSTTEAGSKHPETLEYQSSLAATYCALQDPQKALDTESEVFEIRKSTLGEDYHATLMSMSNQALYLLFTGRSSEAKRQVSNAVHLLEQCAEPEKRYNPAKIHVFTKAAFVYHTQRQFTDARELAFKSYNWYPDWLQDDSPKIAAMSLYSQCLLHEACDQMEYSVAATKEKYGEDHEHTVQRVRMLAYMQQACKINDLGDLTFNIID